MKNNNNNILNKIAYEIEKNRSSKAFYWRFLVLGKDLVYYTFFSKEQDEIRTFHEKHKQSKSKNVVFPGDKIRFYIHKLRKFRNIRVGIVRRKIMLISRELINIKNPDYRYYKYYYARKILSSKPLICKPNKDFELHVLSCKKNIIDSLWSIKTFAYYSGLTFDLYIHSDGSLKKKHKKLYEKHFKNCKIIERVDATKQMEDFLQNYDYCLKYRKYKKMFYCSLKLFDPLYYSSNENILYIDSDILFFKRPSEMIDNIKKKQPFFNRDKASSYSCSAERLNDLFNLKVYDSFNAGLVFFNRNEYIKRLDFIEHFFKTVDEKRIMCSVGPNHHEQTLHALLGTKTGSKRLSVEYQPGNEKATDKTVSCHYFSGGRPIALYTEGLKRLRKNKFLEEYNGKKKISDE